MTPHVSRTVSTCFYQLRRLKGVRKALPMESARTLVSAFVTSRLDYCNGVMAGITQKQTARMQSVLNAAARLLYGGTKRDHITPLIRDKLHWLLFSQRVTYKFCVLVYKSLHNCELAVKDKRRAYELWKKSGLEVDKGAYMQAKRRSKRVVAKAQGEERQRYCDSWRQRMVREMCLELLSKLLG